MGSNDDNLDFGNNLSKSLTAKLANMLKKPVVDTELNETLDSFLNELNQSQEYLSHGIFTVKFAEAGLFLQNAVALYGKKVDLLWDSTLQYQMQLCSHTKPSNGDTSEEAVITQRLNRNKRKKLTLPDAEGSNTLYEDLNVLCDKATEFLKGRCGAVQTRAVMNENTSFLSDDTVDSALSTSASHDGSKSICGFQFPIDSLITNLQTGEKLCNYGDLYLNCAVPFLETSKHSTESFNSTQCIMTTRKNDWLLQRYVTERHYTSKIFWNKMLGDDFEIFRLAHQHEACNVEKNIRSSLDEQARSLCPQAFSVKLSRLSDAAMLEYAHGNNGQVKELVTTEETSEETVSSNPAANPIKKDSDSLFHDGPFDDSNDSDALPEPCDNTMLRSSTDSGICLSEVTELSALQNVPNNNFSDSGISSLQVIQENDDLEPVLHEDINSERILENIGNEIVMDSSDNVAALTNGTHEKISVTSKLITVVHKSNLLPLKDEKRNLKRKLLQEEEFENKVEKRKKLQRFRWLKTTTTTLPEFERFFKHNYQPEFGEGEILESDSDDEADAFSLNADLQNNEVATAISIDAVCTTTATSAPIVDDPEDDRDSVASTISLPLHESKEKVLQDSIIAPTAVLLETNTSIIEEFVDSAVNTAGISESDTPLNTIRNTESESLERLRAVTEWRKFIEPKLTEAEQSRNFDIHEYGTRIMDAIPLESNLSFQDLVDGKPAAEITRLFLASLQLANTYNVELIGPEQGVLANDKLEIKLVSRERYHEHLEEYEAPSENAFREKLARLQALKPSFPLHSTPSKGRGVQCKRRKIL